MAEILSKSCRYYSGSLNDFSEYGLPQTAVDIDRIINTIKLTVTEQTVIIIDDYLGTRAYDNSVYLGACNVLGENGLGQEFQGGALVLSPKGEIIRL